MSSVYQTRTSISADPEMVTMKAVNRNFVELNPFRVVKEVNVLKLRGSKKRYVRSGRGPDSQFRRISWDDRSWEL